jgi:hypothetical protein
MKLIEGANCARLAGLALVVVLITDLGDSYSIPARGLDLEVAMAILIAPFSLAATRSQDVRRGDG